MKNLILTLSLLVFVLPMVSIAQNTTYGEDTAMNYTDINGHKQGRWIKYFPNGQKKYEGFFIDNVPQNEFFHYFPNGRLRAEQLFDENGACDVKLFYKDGTLAAKGAYDIDKNKIGRWELYDTYGTIRKVANYNDEGKIDGRVVRYYRNLKKLTEQDYVNGVKQGSYVFYFADGKKREEGTYVDGMKEGLFREYYPDETIAKEGNYIKNLKEGMWKLVSETGEVTEVEFIHDRRVDGKEIEKEFWDHVKWAKDNQDKFNQPEDFYDNPIEFFRKRPSRE